MVAPFVRSGSNESSRMPSKITRVPSKRENDHLFGGSPVKKSSRFTFAGVGTSLHIPGTCLSSILVVEPQDKGHLGSRCVYLSTEVGYV